MRNFPWVGILVTIIVMVLFLWPGFGEVIIHPNGFLFSKGGDGLKNYFNLGYYLKYDDGLAFTGVNYPYGENLLFTDTQPIYALILNFFDNHICSIGNYSVAIINLSILSGMILASVLLFLILTHYNLPGWYSVIIAVCISLLSPQWDRIHGHLSLSYGFVIPLIWYLLIRYQESADSRRLLWSAILGLAGFIVGGLHLYYILISSGFLFMVLFLEWFSSRKNVHHRAFDWYLLLAAFVPLIALWSLSTLTDMTPDRPISPYGFFVYHANLASIFLPHYGSSTILMNQLFHVSMNWEGRAFIGTASLIFVLGFLLHLIVRLIHNPETTSLLDTNIKRYGFAAFLMLLVAMCIPFEWLRFIPDLISPLKQFRALGRLSWVFFYVINVIAAIYFFKLFKRIQNQSFHPTWRLTMMVFLLSSWIFDATSFYLNHGPVSIEKNDKLENNSEEYLNRFKEAGVKPGDFQAIFSLPLVAVRTDKMTFENDLSAHNEAMKCAFHTGLPIVQSSASRPSLSQTFSSIQLISSPMIRKTRLKDMDQRPLLMLHTKGSNLKQTEMHLLDQGSLLWQDEYIELLVLPISAFEDSLSTIEKEIEEMLKDSLVHKHGKMICFPNCDGVVYRSYDHLSDARATFFGASALSGEEDKLILFDSNYLVREGEEKELSFWIYIDPQFSGMPSYEYFSGDNVSELSSSGRKESREIPEIYENWVRIGIQMNPGIYHRLVLYGKGTTVDNLMIRNQNQRVLISEHQQNLFNNYRVN
ncbi:MAG: hypothetical protein KDC53_04785 [Saprospiraceae bacterium]|nr:hypothetical protein [Saprospiraceae bacterium]